ncbi:hypothetical protein CBR_g37180 [Chara braunii]|uniref:Uncharacterized protein n=1 Tax=Chara braunii TaxID=69332 RepID=A0A388LMC6_CHABU|nr:hypothetical protein CBR_g37180 [Chara braunii]|eukprot:GBG83468.1 hypothetical protein CBR_g37180 [Chara braunii]
MPVCLGTAGGGIAPTKLAAGDERVFHTLSFEGCVVVVVAESAIGFGACAEYVVAAVVHVVEFVRTGTFDVAGAVIAVAAAPAAAGSAIGFVVAAVCGFRSGPVVIVVGAGASAGVVDPLAVGFGASGLVVGASVVSASCVGAVVGPAGVSGFVVAPVGPSLGVAPRPDLGPDTGNGPAELASCLFAQVEVAHVGHPGGVATADGVAAVPLAVAGADAAGVLMDPAVQDSCNLVIGTWYPLIDFANPFCRGHIRPAISAHYTLGCIFVAELLKAVVKSFENRRPCVRFLMERF